MIRMDVLAHSQEGFFCHTVPSPAAVTEGPRGYTELPAERSWLSFVSSVNSNGNLFSLTKYGFIHPSAIKTESL